MTDTEMRRIKATVPVWRGGLAERKRARLEQVAAEMRERNARAGSGGWQKRRRLFGAQAQLSEALEGVDQ